MYKSQRYKMLVQHRHMNNPFTVALHFWHGNIWELPEFPCQKSRSHQVTHCEFQTTTFLQDFLVILKHSLQNY